MDLSRYVDTITLFGDATRLRLCALLRVRDLTVTELVRATNLPQSRVSTHLGRLRDAGAVRDRRVGTSSIYSLSIDGLPPAARYLLDEAISSDDSTLGSDLRRLRLIDARAGSLPDAFVGEMERHYSPGRTWESLSFALTALINLGDVIDIGSGDGAVAALLASQCRSLLCVDANEAMRAAAKSRLAHHSNARTLCADAEALPLSESSFDVALMFHTLTYVEHPDRALQECARVLRVGGRMVLLVLDRHEHTDETEKYGARHPGFAPATLRTMIKKAGAEVLSCGVVCQESRRGKFRVILATAEKRKNPPPLRQKSR